MNKSIAYSPLSSSALSGVNFTLLGFTGKWLSLIGNPSEPFSVMIYGEPGSYKSTLGLLFANYLAKTHNKKVLFVAHEEKVGQKIKEKLDQRNMSMMWML